jgi:hypothetical protein
LRKTLVGAAFVTAGFFAAVPAMPLIVPITAFLTGDLVDGAALVTTVVPELVSVDWLLLLALPFAAFDDPAPWVAFLARPVAAAELPDDEAVTFLAAVARVDLAFSTIFVKMPAAPPGGPMGFKGDICLAR